MRVGKQQFRVAASEPSLLESVRSSPVEILEGSNAFLGFKLDAPTDRRGLFVLLAGNGAVLARSTSESDITASLAHHLSAVASPAVPEGAARLGLRAIVGPDQAVLIDPRLVRAQPLSERRLSSQRLAIVDSPFVDVRLADMTLTGVQPATDGFPTVGAVRGHISPGQLGQKAVAVLWAGAPEGPKPTTAQLAFALTTHVRSATRPEMLRLASDLAQAIDVSVVDPLDAGSLHRSLEGALATVGDR